MQASIFPAEFVQWLRYRKLFLLPIFSKTGDYRGRISQGLLKNRLAEPAGYLRGHDSKQAEKTPIYPALRQI
jgi:hypothetical protein